MADFAKSLRYDHAREKLDKYIDKLPADTCRLSKSEIKEKYPLSIEGWRIPINCGAEVHSIDYLIDWNFPYSTPRLALPSYKDGSHWPHLFEGNYLCLLPNHAEIDSSLPVEAFDFLMTEAHDLIQKCMSGELDDDFDEEFLSYWALRVTEPETPIYSLLKPTGPTRHIVLVEGPKSFIACEKYADGQAWLANRFGEKHSKVPFRKALLVWLGVPPKLKGFSRTNSALLSWLDGLDRDAAKVLKKALKNAECMVIFGFDAGHGTALAAVKVKPNDVKAKGNSRKESIKARLADAGQTQLYAVQRVDHSWLHGRDQDARSAVLKDKSVVLIGCGAVGGSIVVKLAEAGVGTIHCIDPGRLEWGNIGRHVLGGEDVGEVKSKSLAFRLRSRFPHLKFTDYGPFQWQEVYGTQKEVFSNADLIVTTTGSWQADGQLNDLALEPTKFPPILYGWTEAHAVAGHAVLIPPGAACLACHFESKGVPVHKVVSWKEGTQLRREPACGTFFQPFGPIELSFIKSLIADEALGALLVRTEAAIWATWIASIDHVTETGGTWSDEWIESFSDPGKGAARTKREWLHNPNCKVCGEGRERMKSD